MKNDFKSGTWQRAPLFICADSVLGSAQNLWSVAMERGLAEHSLASTTREHDEKLGAEAESLSELSERLFELKKSMATKRARLDAETAARHEVAREFLEAAVRAALALEGMNSALLVGPSESPDRASVAQASESLTQELRRLTASLTEAIRTRALVDLRCLEAAGRNGISSEEARKMVTSRWTDSE